MARSTRWIEYLRSKSYILDALNQRVNQERNDTVLENSGKEGTSQQSELGTGDLATFPDLEGNQK